MGKAWHYLRLDILLNICPGFSILGRSIREELFEISWLDIADHSAVLNRVVVAHN
jgi:hypothetical protein